MALPRSIVAFDGATASAAGDKGLVPAPAAGDNAKFLKGDGSWSTIPEATTSSAGLMSATDKSALDGKLSLSGGTMTGGLNVGTLGERVAIYSDNEGGNIDISHNGGYIQIDGYDLNGTNGCGRIYTTNAGHVLKLYENGDLKWDDNDILTTGTVANATTSQKGVVQLSTATDSTSASLAATPSAVKAAYDLASTANSAAASAASAASTAQSTANSAASAAATAQSTANSINGLSSSTVKYGTAAYSDTTLTLSSGTWVCIEGRSGAATNYKVVTTGSLVLNGDNENGNGHWALCFKIG